MAHRTRNEKIALVIQHVVARETGIPPGQISVTFDRRDAHLWKARRRGGNINITVSVGPESDSFERNLSRITDAAGTLHGGSLTDQIGVRKEAANA